MSYLGDYAEDFADLNLKFTTRNTSGVPTQLAGSPVISVYKSNDVTQRTSADAEITLTVDFDGVTGLNNVKIDLSADAFYVTGEDYAVVITTGTVGGTSVVGETVAHFSIQNRYMRGTDNAALATDLATVDTNVDTLITRVPDTLSLANINAEVDTAIETYHLDHLLAATYDPAAKPGVADALLNELVENDGGVARYTANALEQAPSGGGGGGLTPLASGTAQAGTATTIQLAAASAFANDELNGTVINLTGGTGAGQSRLITDYVGATDTATVSPAWITNPSSDTTYEVVAGHAHVVVMEDINAPSAWQADIADAVWNEATTGHTGAGTFGQHVDDILDDVTGLNGAAMRGTDNAFLAASAPTNFSALAITGGGAVTVGTNNDKSGYSLTADFRVKKNAALSNFMFLMVDSTDHVTPKTGLTVSANRSIDGAAFAAAANSVTEISNGWYKINLAASDLNGDTIALRFNAAGADDTNILIVTQTE